MLVVEREALQECTVEHGLVLHVQQLRALHYFRKGPHKSHPPVAYSPHEMTDDFDSRRNKDIVERDRLSIILAIVRDISDILPQFLQRDY